MWEGTDWEGDEGDGSRDREVTLIWQAGRDSMMLMKIFC